MKKCLENASKPIEFFYNINYNEVVVFLTTWGQLLVNRDIFRPQWNDMTNALTLRKINYFIYFNWVKF